MRNLFAAIGIAIAFSSSANAQATAAPQELLLGPISYTQSIQAIPVTLVSRAYVSLQTKSDGLYLNVRVIGDLSDLQAKIGAIIDTIPLPRDNCRSFSANNPVVTIWGKELKAENATAVLWLHGYVDAWDCRENPIPNSKVEWRVEDIGFGIKTKVPVVVTWPGDPIKNKLATQPFDASQPVTLVAATATSVALQLGDPNIQLGGQFVGITNKILQIAGVDINAKARDALREAIDVRKLQVAVPEEYLKLNPKIELATFEAQGNTLLVKLSLAAHVPAEKVNEVISGLVDQLQKKKI